MRRALVAVLSVLLVVAGLTSPQEAFADGAPPKRIVSGWMPYWMTTAARPAGIGSAVANADLFTDVSPFWFSAVAKAGGGVSIRFNPSFTNAAANAAAAMSQLKGAGLTVLPSIADGSGKGRMAATLANADLRNQHVADIVNLVVTNGYDGIDLDYETFAFTDGSSSWAATQPSWTAFVQALGAALHAQGKLLAVTVPPPCGTNSVCGPTSGYWVYNIAGIAPAADRIRIMAYDYHVNGIGPIAPMPWVRAIVAYTVSIMDPSRLQIGVPTYGRAWTRLDAKGNAMTTGTCPSKSGSAYKNLTAKASINDADIPAFLASVGVAPTDVQWSDADQENWVYYDKKLNWTDGTGAAQTCVAKRVLWFVGPQAVLARTQLVGEFGLSAAAYWTVGGEDASQWPMVRGYAQSLAPAGTDVAITAPPAVVFGTPVAIAVSVTSAGAPVVNVPATLQFRKQGTKKWIDVQTATTGADGSVGFQARQTASGDWHVTVPPADARVEGVSAPITTLLQSLVTVRPKSSTARVGGEIVVRGWARPALVGQSLALQISNGTTWRNVATAKANAKGRARLVAKAPKAKGRYTYRVVAVGRATIVANASPEFRIRVTRR